MSEDDLVLVTGASGFLATHVVKLLQEAGYRVRGTVRSLKDEKKVKHLYNLCPGAKHKLELVEADLLKPDSWAEAVKGCKYIQHIASPFPLANPRHEDEIIKPAVDGTLNVLKAVAAAKTAKGVVLTSSVHAISHCGGNQTPFNEKNWTDLAHVKGLAYPKSKVLAERAAWDFVKDLPADQKFELAVVNPTLIMGPALHGNAGFSTDIMRRLLLRDIPALPRFNLPIIDVRDVALAHLKCMTVEGAEGHRHIINSKGLWINEMAQILDKEFKPQGYNVPTKQLPGWMVTVVGWFDKSIRDSKEFAGAPVLLDTSRMQDVLGITPIDPQTTLIDMAYSMIDNGFVTKTSKYKGRQGQ